jgi:hypothetical protein
MSKQKGECGRHLRRVLKVMPDRGVLKQNTPLPREVPEMRRTQLAKHLRRRRSLKIENAKAAHKLYQKRADGGRRSCDRRREGRLHEHIRGTIGARNATREGVFLGKGSGEGRSLIPWRIGVAIPGGQSSGHTSTIALAREARRS